MRKSVQRCEEGDSFIEETVLKIGHKDTVPSAQVEALVKDAVNRLLAEKNDAVRETKKKGRKRS